VQAGEFFASGATLAPAGGANDCALNEAVVIIQIPSPASSFVRI
jgi:hypothetical protein